MEEVDQERVAETPAAEVVTEQKPAGFDPVDVKTATHEEIEARIRHIFGQLKDTKKENRALKNELTKLQQSLETVKGSLDANTADREIVHIQQLRKEARLAGDDDAVDRYNDQIADLKAEQKVQRAGKQVTQTHIQTQDLDPEREAAMDYIDQWAVATGPNGEFLRPWGINGHPQYAKAIETLHQVTSDPTLAHYSLQDQLKIVERRMKGVPNAGAQVLGKNQLGGSPKGKGTPDLTPEEKKWAERMYTGPKYKTAEDKYKRYAETKKASA